MKAKVILQVIQGSLSGQQFIFEERTSCVIGRAEDCSLRLPNDTAHKSISRHHCLLDINPPDIRVRDFGSLNGTYVNGKKIGQRPKDKEPFPQQIEQDKDNFPEYDLKEGDELKLGETVLKVSIWLESNCAECGKAISGEEVRTVFGFYLCQDCAELTVKIESPPLALKTLRRSCQICGRDVSKEINPVRTGDYICSRCNQEPRRVFQTLLDQASQETGELKTFREYEIVRELGRGGMGAVYLARHQPSGEEIALKIMLPRVADSETGRKMFLREVENTRRLKHMNLVELGESGYSKGVYFFTLEYCESGSLDRLLKARGGSLPIEEALDLIYQVLEGLSYAHTLVLTELDLGEGQVAMGQGLVHRDLTPHNILLKGSAPAWQVKISDFGLAKAFDLAGLSGQSRTGFTAGKPYFIPRQQVVNFKYVRPEVDVWAAAACLYYMLTGAYPRDFARNRDPWAVVLQTDPLPIAQRERGKILEPKLAQVIDYALQDRPTLHFKSAVEFKQALEGVFV